MTLKTQYGSFLLGILFAITQVSANPEYYFKQISLQDGLTQSTVRCILNDHKGFIWIGTNSGLNRYDRHELKTYLNIPEDDQHSLPSNYIHFVAEDSLNNIWVSTEIGLARYNRNDDCFIPEYYKGNHIKVRSFMLTDGGILFGGSNKIYKYNYSTKNMDLLPIKTEESHTSLFNSLQQWKDNLILVGSRWNGIWTYDLQTCELKRTTFYHEKKVISQFIDSKRNVWISPYGKGVLCFSPSGKLLREYTAQNSNLSNNVILDIEEKDNQIWFATDGGGISILNPTNDSFSVIEHIPGNIYSLPVNSIFCLYKDNEDNMWAGSIRGGLLGIRQVFIKTYRDAPLNNQYGLSERTVLSILEDKNDLLWIGTDGGGINKFDPVTGLFTHYPSTYKDKVASITEYKEDELLVSIFSKGLYIFNKKTGNTRPFILIDKERNEFICRSGSSVNINKFSEDKIHFFADKIYVYDIKKDEFSTVKYIGPKAAILSSLQIISSNEYVTYLFGQHNIFELNNKQNTISSIYTPENKSAMITSVCRDGKGRFWIGTTKGLECYDPLYSTTRKIETKLFHEVSSIIYDKQERLWIGAQSMLFAYIINENKFAILGESDGAYPNEFLSKAKLISRTGDIYMGGIMGLMQINKNIQLDDDTPPFIELIDVMLNGISIINKVNKDLTLSIPWNHTSLVIKNMAREQDVFRKKMFRYNVVGLNKYYIETYDHTLTLHSLPAGEYEILVSCSAKDGSWSFPVKVLTISVTPPWWKSSWFISLVIVLILGGVILTSAIIIRQKENKLKWDIKEHEQKTYEEKVRFLINISHELRTPLTLIYAPLKRLLSRDIQDNEMKRQLTGIYKQAKQMKNIINMVLDIRKMEVGQDSLNLQPHLLNEWIKSVTDDFQNEFESKNIKLIYDLDESITEISFDENKCEIVLSNLLMNAFKFSEDDTTIIVSTQITDENMVRISIKDQGIGLAGVDTSKLFTRFYQGNHDRKGSGIGLSYAKTLIEMHKGKIGAINNSDKGATFFYELPLNTTIEKIACEEKPYLNELLYSPIETFPEVIHISTQNYSLLITEDEPELRNFLKETLAEHFKTIYTAENGIEALSIIKQYIPDIVVSDIMMPQMDGFELCKRVKEDINISQIPIILLTARNDAESQSLGYKLGADAYLSKPFEVEFLQTLITNLLKNREFIKSRYKNSTLLISPEEATFSNADEKFLLKLNNLIHENLSNTEMDVKFITENMGMSRASLYNKLKQLTDMGVNDYINKFRIEKAIQLLTQTDLTIMEISDMTGFSNQRYFSTVFKQATGNSPSKFKEEHKKGTV